MSRGSQLWTRRYRRSATLRGRAAVITGADTRVGRAVAVLFAFEGADITAIHRNRPTEAEVTKSVVEKVGGRCLVLSGDVTSERFCHRAVDHAIDAFGSLDVLVNNPPDHAPLMAIPLSGAGVSVRPARAVLRGYSNMTHAAIRYLEGGGVILNRVVQIDAHVAAAVTTQTQIHRFTRDMSSLLRPKDVRVVAVSADTSTHWVSGAEDIRWAQAFLTSCTTSDAPSSNGDHRTLRVQAES